MNFDQIFTEVKLLSKRGDIDDQIKAAIRDVTLRAHLTDYYWRDLIEAKYSWTTQLTLLDLSVNVIQRFRAASYVRNYDPGSNTYGKMLDKIDPKDVLDDYNYEKLNRWYMAGDIMKIKFEWPANGVQIGYYCYPEVYPYTSYGSWIANLFPNIIISGALAQVFNTTGKQEEAKFLNADVGFIIDPGRNPSKGPTLVEQLKQFALEEQAR